MGLYESETYLLDLDYMMDKMIWLKHFEGKSIFITGSTGLIGSAVADILLRYSELHNGNIKIYLAGRSRKRVTNRFSKYILQKYCIYREYDATHQNKLPDSLDYMIHAASDAYPYLIQKNPIETMQDNFCGLMELLQYCVDHTVQNVVYVSSSEIYGRKDNNNPYQENEYGYIDVLNSRSSYPISKRAAETLCASYIAEKDIAVSIVRPGHIYGPTATRKDNRVSTAFAYNASDGKDIIMKSDGAQIRSYCYMLDCASAILYVLLKGKKGEAYNISNPNSIMSIRELAEYLAKVGNVRLKFELPSQDEKKAFNPMNNSSLNSEKLCGLGWSGLFDAKLGLEHTVKIIKEAKI